MKRRGWHFEVAVPDPDDLGDFSYVGLYHDRDTQAQILKLPHGYPRPPLADPHACLGSIMRAVARFSTSVPRHAYTKGDRDGFLTGDKGIRLAPRPPSAPEFSRMDACIRLIRQLDDPRLLAVARVPGLARRFNERDIARGLQHAVFLDDGTPVFEQMPGAVAQLRRMATRLVDLAAWVALDALDHLFPDVAAGALKHSLRAEWEALARRFADDARLKADASLFGAGAERSLSLVQAALDACRRANPPVREDARQLVELLDCYLNAGLATGGTVHGFSGFNRVWEAMCLEHARTIFRPEDIFCCDDALAIDASAALRTVWRERRERVFGRNGTARRPDLVVRLPGGRFRIVDFKYAPDFAPGTRFFDRRPAAPDLRTKLDTARRIADFKSACKAHQDVANIEAYRWLMLQHELKSLDERLVELAFWVPSAEDLAPAAVHWDAWDGGRKLPDSGFHGLQVVYHRTEALVAAFAARFAFF